METQIILPLAITGAVIVLCTYAVLIPVMLIIDAKRKKDDEIHLSFVRMMQQEELQSRKETKALLDRMDRHHQDNAIYLRMIFERVDKPPQES